MAELNSDLNSRKSNQGLYYGWVMLAVCLIFVTIGEGIRFSFGVFFKSLELEFDLTRALTSSIFSVFMVISSLFAILGGWLADRYGPRIIFLAMGTFAFIGFILTSQTGASWQLFISYSLLVALGTGPIYPLASSIATRWFSRKRALALAIVTSGTGLGSILIAPISAYLIDDYGWRISYVVMGIIALVIITPLSLLLRENPAEAKTSSNNIRQSAKGSCVSRTADDKLAGVSIAQILKRRDFLILLAIWFFWAFCLYMVTTHIVRHAIDLNIDSIQAASIISVSGFGNIPARIFMGLVSDKIGKKRAALICASLMVLSMLWFINASSLWMFYVFAVAFGAASGGLTPPTAALVGDTFGLRHIGVLFGLLEIGWVCGAAAGPAVAGYIFDVTGEYFSAFLLGTLATIILLALVLFLRIPVPESKRQ